jgi:hypothetical protein
MKTKKIFKWIGIIVAVIMVALLLCRNLLIKHAIQLGIKKAIGINTSIDKINIGLFQSTIQIKGLTIYNPEGFEGETLAKVPLIYLDYELGPLLHYKMHCTKMKININEITIVKNRKGEINLNRLKSIAEETTSPQKAKKKKETEVKIDKLILTVDHVKFVDYSKGKRPEQLTIPIGLNREEFKNLNSTEEIVRVIALKTIVSAGLCNIGILIDKISTGLEHIGGKGMETLKQGLEKYSKSVKSKTHKFLKRLKMLND